MIFEWDEAKNLYNQAKHRVGFEAGVDFEWHGAVIIDRTRAADNEPRYAAIGLLTGKVYTVIFTKRGNRVRIISLRRSNRTEEKIYETTHP